jgi:Lsr2
MGTSRSGWVMAQKAVVSLVDDLDGGQADETVVFGLDGKSYEIDLSAANAAKLREAIAEFAEAARRPSGGRHRGGSNGVTARPAADREQNHAIREWARARNLKVSERGRLPAEVLEAYHQAS